MTEDKIFRIKEHIEIHARREPQARRITEILWEAVKELEQYEKMKCCSNCKHHSREFLPYFCIKNQTPTHCTELCDKWELSD